MQYPESSLIAEPFLTGKSTTLSQIYSESSKNLNSFRVVKAKHDALFNDYEKLKKEYDSKIPFFNELERKYKLATKQVSQTNITVTKLLCVISVF